MKKISGSIEKNQLLEYISAKIERMKYTIYEEMHSNRVENEDKEYIRQRHCGQIKELRKLSEIIHSNTLEKQINDLKYDNERDKAKKDFTNLLIELGNKNRNFCNDTGDWEWDEEVINND